MTLSVMSGLGGGGITVPLLMIFYQMDTKSSVAISGFTILLGSIARFFFTINNRHPNKDATCIEYGLTNIMLPTVLTGSMIGVYLNMLLPPFVLQLLLSTLLIMLCTQSSIKAKAIYDKETKEMQREKYEVVELESFLIPRGSSIQRNLEL